MSVQARPGSYVYDAHEALGILPAGFVTHGLHPVQLYEAGIEILLAGFLILLFSSRKGWSGQVALVYLALGAPLRFLTEIYRGDAARGFVGEPIAMPIINHVLGVDGGSPTFLSVPQAGVFLVALVVAWFWVIARPRRVVEPHR